MLVIWLFGMLTPLPCSSGRAGVTRRRRQQRGDGRARGGGWQGRGAQLQLPARCCCRYTGWAPPARVPPRGKQHRAAWSPAVLCQLPHRSGVGCGAVWAPQPPGRGWAACTCRPEQASAAPPPAPYDAKGCPCKRPVQGRAPGLHRRPRAASATTQECRVWGASLQALQTPQHAPNACKPQGRRPARATRCSLPLLRRLCRCLLHPLLGAAAQCSCRACLQTHSSRL